MSRIPLPQYSSSRHPIETWQEWYRTNQSHIRSHVQYQSQHRNSMPSDQVRLVAPYEYTDSLNQRQVWEPYLTGRERQEFDSQLRTFMKQNRSTMLRLRPGPISSSPSSSQQPPPSSSSSSRHSHSSHSHSSSSASSSRHQSSSSSRHQSSSSAMPRSSSSSSSRHHSSSHAPSSSSSSSRHHHHHPHPHPHQPPTPQYYTRH